VAAAAVFAAAAEAETVAVFVKANVTTADFVLTAKSTLRKFV
jgi:hypothetical protein